MFMEECCLSSDEMDREQRAHFISRQEEQWIYCCTPVHYLLSPRAHLKVLLHFAKTARFTFLTARFSVLTPLELSIMVLWNISGKHTHASHETTAHPGLQSTDRNGDRQVWCKIHWWLLSFVLMDLCSGLFGSLEQVRICHSIPNLC